MKSKLKRAKFCSSGRQSFFSSVFFKSQPALWSSMFAYTRNVGTVFSSFQSYTGIDIKPKNKDNEAK